MMRTQAPVADAVQGCDATMLRCYVLFLCLCVSSWACPPRSRRRRRTRPPPRPLPEPSVFNEGQKRVCVPQFSMVRSMTD